MELGTRREQILAAASELAAESGMAALSVRAVARRSGIGPSTLRHYFPTQRDLFDAVTRESFDAHLEDLNIHDAARHPAARLTECLMQFLPPDDDHSEALQTWLSLLAAALGTDRTAQAQDLLATLSTRSDERIEHWLAVLAAEGALRHEDQTRHLLVLNTLVDGLSLQFLSPGSAITVASAQQILTDAVTELVLA